jgi:hypothetical protein
MATFGALALLTPMLIMAIHPTLKKSLITSNVAVFVVAVILAWRSSGKPNDVLTTTAAYAAVLVVFVAPSDPGSEVDRDEVYEAVTEGQGNEEWF